MHLQCLSSLRKLIVRIILNRPNQLYSVGDTVEGLGTMCKHAKRILL
jgi:hypothetical protein